jgi:hypothetical protein
MANDLQSKGINHTVEVILECGSGHTYTFTAYNCELDQNDEVNFTDRSIGNPWNFCPNVYQTNSSLSSYVCGQSIKHENTNMALRNIKALILGNGPLPYPKFLGQVTARFFFN